MERGQQRARYRWLVVAVVPMVLWAAGCRRVSHRPDRPNILLIVVDTLRYDHLTFYGYERRTSPELERLLARRGAVVEEAYAQAPWTLPSMLSLMSGRYPGDLVSSDLSSFAIPDGVETLAERLESLGYRTAGFCANPTLHAGNGFARGFDTFYSAPAERSSLHLHGEEELQWRAQRWLQAPQDPPFFVWVHYLDPHDPYESPCLVDGRSPFYPGYGGDLTGRSVHSLYAGRRSLDRPEEDIRHLQALYDSEIRYVDGLIGELLASLAPQTMSRTLVVLTADHGEELHDHGGWKHGQTLYEEQIHVPLLLRWDGHIPAGTRLGGTVRLLDLAPTLVAAVEGKIPEEWEGVNLLPALTSDRPLPPRPAFAQHLSPGPLRAAAILNRRKLILFNRSAPFSPMEALYDHLWRQDLERLERIEMYDLAGDPRERVNIAAGRPGWMEPLAAEIHRRLNHHLSGLRIMARGWQPGVTLRATIRFDEAPSRWLPYFLSPQDHVDLSKKELTLSLQGEGLEKGLVVEGDFAAIEFLELYANGNRLARSSVRLGSGARWSGGRIERSQLRAAMRPKAGADPVLNLWEGEKSRVGPRDGQGDEETAKRLRALGYLP